MFGKGGRGEVIQINALKMGEKIKAKEDCHKAKEDYHKNKEDFDNYKRIL